MLKSTKEEAREMALAVVEMVKEKKAVDVVLLNVGKVTYLADYFLMCSGASAQQVQAICESVLGGLEKRMNLKPIRVEGYREAEWVLIDYGMLVVHVFRPDKREFYNLERLWSEADPVVVPE